MVINYYVTIMSNLLLNSYYSNVCYKIFKEIFLNYNHNLKIPVELYFSKFFNVSNTKDLNNINNNIRNFYNVILTYYKCNALQFFMECIDSKLFAKNRVRFL